MCPTEFDTNTKNIIPSSFILIVKEQDNFTL
jgi:hypothetical protein